MRTTVRMGDELYRRVKVRAAQTGRSVGELIEDAVRAALEPSPPAAVSIAPLPVYRGTGVLPGVDLGSHATVLDAMDADEPLDALR